MLSYREAIRAIRKHSRRLPKKPMPLEDCLGRIVAQDMRGRFDFPSFDNAAVDGFAVGRPRQNQTDFAFCGEVPAGDGRRRSLKAGQAMHVFTGAPVPSGTCAVVMQEAAQRINGRVIISKAPRSSENVRFRGEDFMRGKVLVRNGELLEPQHLALLAAGGYKTIPVHPAPRVAIFATGSELLAAGQRPEAGKIYDANTPLLRGLVKKAGGTPEILSKTADTLESIRQSVREGLTRDVLLVSGGVSVGKYDFVKEAFEIEGVREIFWKVNIKPGKPLFFGKKGRTLVFGLPGNPVSVFITFDEFVRPALLAMQGKRSAGESREGYLTKPFLNGSRLHFVRVECARRAGVFQVTPLKGQGSHQIAALARAGAILRVAPDAALKRGERVQVKMMNGGIYA